MRDFIKSTLISFLLIGTTVFAATTIGTNIETGGTISAIGNVGIGTTTPTDTLYVFSNSNSSKGIEVENASGGASAYAQVVLKNDTGTSYNMGLGSSGAYGSITLPYSLADKWFIYNTNPDIGGGAPLAIDKLDNVYIGGDLTEDIVPLYIQGTLFGPRIGINTQSPGALLDIQGLLANATTIGYGTRIMQTLKATVDNSTFNALYIDSTFNDNGHTNVNHNGLIVVSGKVGIATTTPFANLQVANGTNATTTREVGSANQNKGSCLKLYRTDGSAIYAYVAAGTTAFTLSTVACATVSGF